MVEPRGTISTSNDHGRTHLREALRGRGHPTAKRVLGLDYRALAALGARGGEVVTDAGLLVEVEPMFAESGRVSALLVRAEPPDGSRARAPASHKRDRARGFARIAGSDPTVRMALGLAERFARASLPILVVAEPGAGTRDLVLGIHAESAHRDEPFVPLDPSSIEPGFVKSAVLIGLASTGGTLFIEGLEDVRVEVQDELLAELEHGALHEVLFVGSVRSSPRALVDAGLVRQPLHQALRAATITLPPLRDRTDKVALAERMLAEIAPAATLSAAARSVIERHRFPGNLLELEGALEHASALSDGVVEPRHFPEEMLDRESVSPGPAGTKLGAERAAIEEAVRFAAGNMSVAAKRLGVARSTLYRMLERHGMVRP